MAANGERHGRIFGLDLARGLALAAVVATVYRDVLAPDAVRPRQLSALSESLEGKGAALFVTVAGFSAVLLGRPTVLLRRAVLLLVFGYAAVALWPREVLHHYGAYLLIGAAALGVPVWALALGVVGAVAGFVALFGPLEWGADRNWVTSEYQDLWTVGGLLREQVFNGWQPLLPWIAFFLCGMALARASIHRSGRRRLWIALGAVVFAWGAGQLSTHWSRQPDQHWPEWWRNAGAVWGTDPTPPMPLFVAAAAGSAVAVLCACLELGRMSVVRTLAGPIAAAGRLALTFYALHVLVGIELFDALGLWDGETLVDAWLRAGAFVGGVLIVATLWLRRFANGPLEWLLRRCSG